MPSLTEGVEGLGKTVSGGGGSGGGSPSYGNTQGADGVVPFNSVWQAGPGFVGNGPATPTPTDQLGYMGDSSRSPFRVMEKFQSLIPGMVTNIDSIGSGVVTVKLAGDDAEIIVPLDTSHPTVGQGVNVGFGQGGHVGVVGLLGGFT